MTNLYDTAEYNYFVNDLILPFFSRMCTRRRGFICLFSPLWPRSLISLTTYKEF